MKRTAKINLENMRKSTVFGRPLLRPLTLAITSITLAACSDPEQEVQIVSSIEDCNANTSFTIEQCKTAYQSALIEAQRTAPRYNSQAQCEAEFGYDQCNRSGSFFTPFMAGYIVSNALNSLSQSYNPVYHYRNGNSSLRNRIMMADGTIVGRAGQSSYKVNPNNLRPKPTVTRTVSRGGFGSVASAKSNWGGGKKSSWGG